MLNSTQSGANERALATSNDVKILTKGEKVGTAFFDSSSFNKTVSDELEKFLTTIPDVLQQLTKAHRSHLIDLREYNGDPEIFDCFIDSLPYFLDELEPDSNRRLCYLNQALRGRAKAVIQVCFYEVLKDPYEYAKELLKKYFGQQHIVDKAELTKYLSTKRIKSGDFEGIRGLYIDIMCIKKLLESSRYADQLNNSNIFLRLIRRLPQNLQDDWRKVADEIINIKGQKITIEDIHTFVDNNRWSRTYKDYKPTEIPENKDSLCQLCEDVHKLHDCDAFQNMTQTQRMKYVTKKRLCLGCLTPNHSLNNCSNAVSCPINNCKSKHHKLLHEYLA